MLAKDVCRVDLTSDMVEYNHPCSNSFTDTVERQHSVLLMKLGMYFHRTVDHRLVVTKHVALVTEGDTYR